jgi:DNA repair photolyase
VEGEEMSIVKSKGNMYDWVTHMHTHLAGECSHKCSYCYVQTGPAQMSGKYKGPFRLVEKELEVNYGAGKIIFIEHMNDLFAWAVPKDVVSKILAHACQYPDNDYVFQTKNPIRAHGFTGFPPKMMMGTTIETNRSDSLRAISGAPHPWDRACGITWFSGERRETFITIEPIMDFDLGVMADWIIRARPSFVNIGADSKRCNLPEPSAEKVRGLIAAIAEAGIEIKKKHNLGRLLP